jgi:hypothetical protein
MHKQKPRWELGVQGTFDIGLGEVEVLACEVGVGTVEEVTLHLWLLLPHESHAPAVKSTPRSVQTR